MSETGLGLKAATITPEAGGDVGSPNRILREEIGGTRDRAHRPADPRRDARSAASTHRSPSSAWPWATPTAPANGARVTGDDEVAFRTERIERRVCRAVAEFCLPARGANAREGLRRAEVHGQPDLRGHAQGGDGCGRARHSEVRYEPQLIDATFALLLPQRGDPLVIPTLNRDGDILSDFVLAAVRLDRRLGIARDRLRRRLRAAGDHGRGAHGTAPALFGKNVANPLAMILAGASLLTHMERRAPQAAGRAIREASLEAVAAGTRTADLGGHASTTEFTDEVIERVRQKLEVWSSLSEV